MENNVKLNDSCYLITQEIPTNLLVKDKEEAINHIIIIDVSGSMYYDLPEIRKNLKNKISTLVKPKDSITIIWFSGKNEAGVLKENVRISSLKQLGELNDAIDRFLKPIGMTAFAKPFELANDAIERMQTINQNELYSIVFMSDGYCNDTSWENVKNALNKISNKLTSATIVEYGFYSDTKRLTEMAEILGGCKINCSGFEDYDIIIGNNFNKIINGRKKITINIEGQCLHDFAFSVDNDGTVLVYLIRNNSVVVNEGTKNINYFSSNSVGVESTDETLLYAAAYVLSDKLMDYNNVEKIMAILGDNFLYKMLSSAYGKQKLNIFKTNLCNCVIDESKRFIEGREKIKPINDNAYCLMNLINDLGTMENCLFFPNHESFNYNRIGRKKVAVGSKLNDSDQQRLSEAKNVAEASALLKEFEDKKIDLEFINTNPDRGYPLNALVWNSSRANLSVLCKIDGIAKLPKNKYNIDEIASFKYNTFTLIKDGIVNLSMLPVNYSLPLEQLLIKNSVEFDLTYDDKITSVPDFIIIDLSSLPIINRGMVHNISANQLGELEWLLLKIQGENKVFDYYRKSLFPKESKSFADMLGVECADWLKEIGITDYNGFAPKVESVPSTDVYMSVNLNTKIKGLSSIPKVEDVLAKMAKAGTTLKTSEWLMAGAIKDYAMQIDTDIYKALPAEQQKIVLGNYLTKKSDELNKLRRMTLKEIAKIKFGLILSKKWFSEFKSFDENQLSLNLDGQSLEITFSLEEKEEKI
jgi:hypothetical protein